VSVTENRPALERLAAIATLTPPLSPTPIEELSRLRAALTAAPRLLVKRDDAIPFAFGGNKVRKLQIVAAQALAAHADTLITTGGIQSNHARATAAIAARLGLGCVIVANGAAPPKPTANALLDRLLGADVRYVATRDQRAPAMDDAARELTARGRRPFVIPLGASTPHGAAAYARAVGEMLTQLPQSPDVIVVATSSGGTQAGIIAGCRLHGVQSRVIGVSADDPSAAIAAGIRTILDGLESLIDVPSGTLSSASIEVDDRCVGEGYGIPTAASTEAIEWCARGDAVFLDPTYTSKAMAALIARVRSREFTSGTILFWHTGGQVGLFA
jgi:1-aminocyclopropane-1-carboxylate deaminase/D-cysteine desulfhydrase-like pyridoxal-dependent ACC family enzyme